MGNQIRLTLIEDDGYRQLYRTGEGIFQAEHGGDDPDTLLFVQVEHTDEWGDSPECKYHASIFACGHGWPSESELQSALDSYGMSREEFDQGTAENKSLLLADHGLRAVLWQEGGNNIRQLLSHARQQLRELRFTIGFRLDAPQNAIGSSGWDFMRGDILAGIR